MARITALTRSALPNPWFIALLWFAIALALAGATRAAEPAAGDSLHHSAALAQQHAEHFGNRMQATAHQVMDATRRGLHRAFDATARGTRRAAEALAHAADRAKSAFHNI